MSAPGDFAPHFGDCPVCGAQTGRYPVGVEAGKAISENAFDPGQQIEPGGRRFIHAECTACGLVFTVPSPTPEELSRVYRSRYNYAWFRSRRGLKRLQARHRWRRIRTFLPETGGRSPALLDIGAGQGDFVMEARRAGWAALGLDPALPETIPGFRRDFESDAPLPGGPFDVITLWHTLEHLRDPLKVLMRTTEALRAGGVLILAVPNRNAQGLSRAGRDWGWFQEPFVHLWHWSPNSLRKIIPQEFTILDISTRDTWDQQTFFTTTIYRQAVRAGRILMRLLPAASGAGAGEAGSIEPPVAVWGREALHLAGYAGYLAARNTFGVRRDRRLEGAELMLIAARSPGEVPGS